MFQQLNLKLTMNNYVSNSRVSYIKTLGKLGTYFHTIRSEQSRIIVKVETTAKNLEKLKGPIRMRKIYLLPIPFYENVSIVLSNNR